MEMNLIYKEAHRARWTGLELADRIGIASLMAVEAERNWDPSRGKLSTATVHYIRNEFINQAARTKTRMKYDGVQASCLLPSQIPAADTPDPERQTIFRDQIARLPEDSQLLVNIALHTPREVRGSKNVLKAIGKMIKTNRGWSEARFQKAVNQVRQIL